MKPLISAVFALFLMNQSFAGAAPVTRMQTAVSGVIQQKMTSRGFAVNDPRYSATLNACSDVVSAAAGGGAAVVVAGAVTAPAWATAAIAAGAGALVGVGVKLAVDGITEWAFGSDSSQVDVRASQATSIVFDTPTTPPSPGKNPLITTYMDATGRQLPAGTIGPRHLNAFWNDFPFKYCCIELPDGSAVFAMATRHGMFPDYYNEDDTQKTLKGETGVLPIQNAIDQISDSEKSLALNPQIIAALANALWQLAAQKAGYQGLPYLATDPITTAEATAWQQANANSWPTVGDFTWPQTASNSPWSLPSGNPGSGTGASNSGSTTNPGKGEQVNLGPDPAIGSPTLEDTPTAKVILQPLLDLFPSLRTFSTPAHSVQCPKPQFEFFGKFIEMSSHCAIAEKYRPEISAVMAVAWLLLATLILLSA